MQIADISVLTTRLPAVDRGTLSRAWIDALHLHREGAPDAPARPRPAAQTTRETGRDAASPRPRVAPRSSASVVHGGERGVRLVGPHRRIATQLACGKATKTAAPALAAPRRAESAIIHLPCGERLCLIMRGAPRAMTVTVLCSSAMRERATRAMAHIRAMLAAEGTHCNVEIQEKSA